MVPQLWNLYHQQRKYNSFLLVGGAVKRLVKLESLRRPFENQILTPWDMYQQADENIENIKFFCVSIEDIVSDTSIIQNRLTIAETNDGTRSYHCFLPNGQTKLELYTLSADEICITVVMTKTASFGHPEMIYIICHSSTLFNVLNTKHCWKT